jgi:YD repeat-containing protein
MAGRTVSTKTPGTPGENGALNADLVVSDSYDPVTGAPWKTSATAGPSPQLSLSDPLGSTRSSGLDADGDDSLSAAAGDRFSTSKSFYQKIAGAWWQTSEQMTAISAAASTTTTSRRRMDVGSGEVSVFINPTGATTSSQTYDRATQTTTTITIVPGGQTLTRIEVAGRLVSQGVPGMTTPELYQYDNLGREIQRTDPRGASTWSFGYNGFNQLEKVRDQLGNITTYAYYPANHQNAGQLWKTIDARGGTTGTTETIYNTRGQTQEITGSATYRQVYGYDMYGDQETLATFGTVPATTTWMRHPATGLLTFKKYANHQGTHYTYTADGKIAKRTWQRGITTIYGYSSTFRDLIGIDYSDSTPDVAFSAHDLYGRPGTVVEKRGALNDTTTLTYDPVTGAQSTRYAADHSILPGLSVVANAPENGRPTGHAVTQGATTIHGWTFGYDDFGRIDELTAGSVTRKKSAGKPPPTASTSCAPASSPAPSPLLTLSKRYKDLSAVENAFRSIKTVDLKVRPINHYNADRVRCHIFLCMLAYHVEWHMRQALKPLLFDENDAQAARLACTDVVSPKKPSPSARAKANGKTPPDGLPVHSFQTLLGDLATLTRNTIMPKLAGAPGWTQDSEPTPLQIRAIELLATHAMP